MRSFLTNKEFCKRVALLAGGVWLGAIAICSAIFPKFYWFSSWQYEPPIGPATITAAVGAAVIFILAVGIPWVSEAAKRE
jgi:hypothetical protein